MKKILNRILPPAMIAEKLSAPVIRKVGPGCSPWMRNTDSRIAVTMVRKMHR